MKQMSNNRTLKLLITAAILGISIICVEGQDTANANENPEAARRYIAAYESMDMGNWLAKQDMEEAAVELYQEALDRFRLLAREYPAWQRELVEYRMTYCANQLERINIIEPAPEREPEQALAINSALRIERMPDLKGALDAYSAILKQQPGQLQALKGAARCHLRMGSIDSARDLFRTNVTEPVSDSELLLLMALVECHDQQFDRAIQLLRLANEANRMNVEAYVAMGVALAGQGRFDAAEAEMKKALSLNSRVSEAYYNLSWISLRRNPGKPAIASTHYANALRYGAEPDPLLEKLFQ